MLKIIIDAGYCANKIGVQPYPNDCTKYVICDGTNMIVYSCPTGTYFNINLNICDWTPANCGSATTVLTTTTTTTTTSLASACNGNYLNF